MTGPTLELLESYRRAVPAAGRRVVVDGSRGDDTRGDASDEAPVRTIPAALALARPGDRLLIAPGRYPPFQVDSLNGSAGTWTSIECADLDDRPIIDASTARGNGIQVRASRFVGIFGLDVLGAVDGPDEDASGIAIFGGSAFVRVWACSVATFPGGGINCFWAVPPGADGGVRGGWDCVELAHNRITGCCRRSPSNTSGISFFGAETLVEGGFDGDGYRALHNEITDCRCEVPYSIGGFDFVTDGNGISIDCLVTRNSLTPDLEPYPKRGRIEHNVVRGNGGRGLHVLNSVNVTDRFNTYDRDLLTESPAFDGAAEVEVHLDPSIDAATAAIVHVGNSIRPAAGRRAYRGPVGTVPGAGKRSTAQRDDS